MQAAGPAGKTAGPGRFYGPPRGFEPPRRHNGAVAMRRLGARVNQTGQAGVRERSVVGGRRDGAASTVEVVNSTVFPSGSRTAAARGALPSSTRTTEPPIPGMPAMAFAQCQSRLE